MCTASRHTASCEQATFLPLDQQGNQLAPREEDGTLFYKTKRKYDEKVYWEGP